MISFIIYKVVRVCFI